MSGLDDWLPRYEQQEHHERFVRAPPAEPDRVVASLFRLRGLDARGKSLAGLFAPPWATVLEQSPTAASASGSTGSSSARSRG